MKIVKIISMVLASFLLTSITYGYEVTKVDVQDDKTMEISLDDEVQFSQWEITWDIKILKDVSISMSSKDFEELDKVVVTLDNNLEKNSNYSLLSIFWADWSIDFKTWDNVSWVDLNNPESINISEQWIVKVSIKDPKTIEVYFNAELEWEEFEFKLLEEVTIESLSSIWENTIIVKSTDTLESSTDYMLVLVSLTDWNGLELSFDEDIFDFTTEDEIVKTEVSEEAELELNAAWEEVDIEEHENYIDNVASNVTETPDTWAETWVLIFGTLLINSFYFIARRKETKA